MGGGTENNRNSELSQAVKDPASLIANNMRTEEESGIHYQSW